MNGTSRFSPIALCVILALLLSSCQFAPPPLQAQPGAEDVVRALMFAWADGDMDTAAQLYAEDAYMLVDYPGHPEFNLEATNREEILAIFEGAQGMNHTNRYQATGVDGNTVTGRMKFINDVNSYYGIEAELVSDTSTVENGQVVEEIIVVSPESVAQRATAFANEAVLTVLMDAWATGDMEAALALYDEDAVVTIEYPGHPEWTMASTGSEEIRALFEYAVSVNHTNHYEIVQIAGDTVTTNLAFYNDTTRALHEEIPEYLTDTSVVKDGKVVREEIVATAATVAQRELMESTEANKLVYRRAIFEFFQDDNLDTLHELYPEDQAAMWKDFWVGYKAAFPDVKYELHSQMAEGDRALNHWTIRATHAGEFMGVPATGKQIEAQGIFIGRIEDGQIVEDMGVWDIYGLMLQIGGITDPMQAAANKEIARRVFDEIWNQGMLDAAYEIFAEDAVFDGLVGDLTPGPESYANYVGGYREVLPDIHFTIEDQLAMDDRIFTRWSATGTHQGELMGAPPTGNEVAVRGMVVSRIEDGKIVENWSNFDALGMFRQLGFALTPPEVGDEAVTEATEGLLGFSTFGDGPEKVIAIHNFWDNQKQYEPVQPYLDGQTYTFAFPDLRGYGTSRDIQGEYTAEEAAQDIIALADHLGWDRFHLVGHSMSGMIVQRVAVEAEERVKSIVALTPVPASGTQLDEDTVGFFASVVADRQSTYDYFRMAIPMFSESYAAFRADRSWESATPEVKLGYLRMWNNTDFSQETQGLETPILVVLGEYDEGFNQLVMPFWSDWYANSEIITGANATHHITEDAPVFVASAIENFLAQHR